MATGLYTHPEFLRHEMGPHHPECPDRLRAIEDQLIASRIDDLLVPCEAPPATEAQLCRVHRSEYVRELVASVPIAGYMPIDPDTSMNPHTYMAAVLAAGAAVDATDKVIAGELENACTLTAQRLSLLSEQAAPEFFDKALFRGFIQKLRERKIVWTDEAGKLDYDSALDDMVRDARVILAREVRHSILKITPGGNDDRHELDRDDDKAMRIGPAAEATPPDASPADLHARHVEAAHRVHVHEPVEPVGPTEPGASRDEGRPD